MLIDMKVSSLTVDPFTDVPVVILEPVDPPAGSAVAAEAGVALPIWIGKAEASAIAAELAKVELDRPMTHDLMTTMLARCRVAVDRVEVLDLQGETFYAAIVLRRECGELVTLDARPSDAIALAIRTGAVIRVAHEVIEKARSIHPCFEPFFGLPGDGCEPGEALDELHEADPGVAEGLERGWPERRYLALVRTDGPHDADDTADADDDPLEPAGSDAADPLLADLDPFDPAASSSIPVITTACQGDRREPVARPLTPAFRKWKM